MTIALPAAVLGSHSMEIVSVLTSASVTAGSFGGGAAYEPNAEAPDGVIDEPDVIELPPATPHVGRLESHIDELPELPVAPAEVPAEVDDISKSWRWRRSPRLATGAVDVVTHDAAVSHNIPYAATIPSQSVTAAITSKVSSNGQLYCIAACCIPPTISVAIVAHASAAASIGKASTLSSCVKF